MAGVGCYIIFSVICMWIKGCRPAHDQVIEPKQVTELRRAETMTRGGRCSEMQVTVFSSQDTSNIINHSGCSSLSCRPPRPGDKGNHSFSLFTPSVLVCTIPAWCNSVDSFSGHWPTSRRYVNPSQLFPPWLKNFLPNLVKKKTK